MRALKWKITYEQGDDVIQRFPEILGEQGKTTWEEMKTSKEEEMKVEAGGKGEAYGVLHGDFWTGKCVTHKTCTQDGPLTQTPIFH